MSRILVVDDDPYVARTLLDLLAHHGFPASRAESGEQALEALGQQGADLVILDLRLPGVDGFETCARIREAYGASLPVIMLTALGDAASLRAGYEAGADDFLTKPVDTPALILKVRAFLRLKALHDETVRHREEAQARARDLAQLHEIGRDWSLIAEPAEFNRMVTQRLAALIGAQACLIILYDPSTRTMAAAWPTHGLPDDVARRVRYVVKPEYRSLWNFRSGRPYVSNRAKSDPRLVREMVEVTDAESALLVPIVSEGAVMGLLAALNKPGGFTDADTQLLSIFAGPAASFIRSRQIFSRERRHTARLERLAGLVGEMGATPGRGALLELVTSRLQSDLGYDRVAFFATDLEQEQGLRLEAESRSRAAEAERAADGELMSWALKGSRPLQSDPKPEVAELAVPVRAGEDALGVLALMRTPGGPFPEEEVHLLSTLAGHLALALQRTESAARSERMTAQAATLHELGLQTGRQRDLRQLFQKAAEEAGRLIRADHTSVLRFDEREGTLGIFAAWGRDHARESYGTAEFRLGEGIAGRVARDRVPVMLNEVEQDESFVPRANPISRILCVPLTYFDQERQDTVLFGVLNATRGPGARAPRFTRDDLDYATRFASQLAVAVANWVAFATERERSEQLALVNKLIREIAGNLSRERILSTAVRRIHEAFRFPVVTIAAPEPETGTMRLAACISHDPRPEVPGPLPPYSGVTGRATREKRTQLVPDVAVDPDYVRIFSSTRSEVAIPIFSGDEVVAVLNVESDARSAFDRGQVITLETLADGIGIILRNAELYQALERNNGKLVELDRMKSELVNIVAHDFRAPLAGVLGHAELLEWRPDGPVEDRVEQARSIIHAATHMANLVDKTLKTTRLETGHFPFEFGLMDLGAVVRVIADRHGGERHSITLDLPDDPVPCWADRDRIGEVLENLISNAVKYSPDGGEVRVGVVRQPEVATVSVTDRGIGIAAEEMNRLFRPFSRVRNRRTAEIEGSGLGLYICDRIVRAHGGRMNVESHVGAGSSFTFSLPLYGVAAQTRAPLVLVATGDERTRRAVRRVVEDQGFAIHEVGDGVDAVEAALRLIPVVVVVDRVLPRLGAAQVAERLRESGATQSIPLLALADRTELGTSSALFSAFLPKPVAVDALASALETFARSPSAP